METFDYKITKIACYREVTNKTTHILTSFKSENPSSVNYFSIRTRPFFLGDQSNISTQYGYKFIEKSNRKAEPEN